MQSVLTYMAFVVQAKLLPLAAPGTEDGVDTWSAGFAESAVMVLIDGSGSQKAKVCGGTGLSLLSRLT